MKQILIVAALCGILIPALASAELNYNAVDAGYATTTYLNRAPDLNELDAGISKSIFGKIYLAFSYGEGNQYVRPAAGHKSDYRKLGIISEGAGYHTPLTKSIDAIAEAHITHVSSKLWGISTRANGNDIGAGVRAEFGHGLEGTLKVIHASISDGISTSKKTFLKAQFGFNMTPWFQMTGGIDFKPDQTISLGLRYFY